MTFQELIDAIESLPIENQDYLFELIRKRRIEKRRDEIAANAKEVFKAVEMGTTKRGSVEDLIADLVAEDEISTTAFWDATLRFRQKIQQENIVFTDEDFAGLRDRSVGRDIEL
jgi:hypothetical protein